MRCWHKDHLWGPVLFPTQNVSYINAYYFRFLKRCSPWTQKIGGEDGGEGAEWRRGEEGIGDICNTVNNKYPI